MSGYTAPLACCDRDCAAANGCREGGYQCESCGRWFCIDEMSEGLSLCTECKEAEEKEEE